MAEQQPEDLRAVILNRVSSIRQEDGFSLDAQDELNREYCKKKHLIIVQAFTFSESAGPKKIRTEFQSVLDFLRKHEIRHLVVEKTDRLLRNFYDYIKIEEMMQDHGLFVHFPKEGSIIHKYSNSHEKQVFGFKVLIAKGFLDNLSEETKKGLLKKVQAGGYPIRAPFGYIHDAVEKQLRINEPEAGTIRELFDTYARENISVEDLADRLNANGIRPPRGDFWYGSTIHKILKNPVYYGDVRWKGKLYKGAHEGIVSYQQWQNSNRKLVKSGGPKNKRFYLLAGFLRYENGRLFSGEMQKQKVYYGARLEERGRTSPRIYVREDQILQQFDALVSRMAWSDQFARVVNELAAQMIRDEKQTVDRNRSSFELQLRALHEKKSRLLDLYTDGHLDRAIYLQKMAELERNESYLGNKLEQYKSADDVLEKRINEVALGFLSFRLEYAKAAAQQKMKILRRMCHEAIVDKNSQAELRLKEPFARFISSEILEICQTTESVRHHPSMRPLGESNPCCGNENPES